MTWWCSASTLPWSWTWKPYLGVWIFLLALGIGYWQLNRRTGAAPDRRARRYFAIGLLLLWASLDWPLGKLSGYLASAHAGQFMLLAMAAPPFLLLGLRPAIGRLTGIARLGRFLAHPLPAFLIYNFILVITHVPAVVDAMMDSQAGSFTLDVLWLASGLALWWPVTAPAPLRRMNQPLQMGYLFVQTIPATLPSAFLIFANYPLYRLYEFTPRVADQLTPHFDHQVAGLLMKIVGDPIIWVGIAVIFFSWANAERQKDVDHQTKTIARPARSEQRFS